MSPRRKANVGDDTGATPSPDDPRYEVPCRWCGAKVNEDCHLSAFYRAKENHHLAPLRAFHNVRTMDSWERTDLKR